MLQIDSGCSGCCGAEGSCTHAAGGGAIFSVAQGKIKLSSILSQVDESESGMMSEQGMVACYMRCSALYKGNENPPKESEPTVEQL